MKYLYIIRHAKAEKFINGQDDHDRNLISKGIKRAGKLSFWLKNVEPKLEKIFSETHINMCAYHIYTRGCIILFLLLKYIFNIIIFRIILH